MTCDLVRDLLDRYAAGTLDQADHALVAEHLRTCAGCAADLADAHAVRAAVAMMPRELQPAGDLWPGIRVRLADRGARRSGYRARLIGLAAAAILLVAASSVVTLRVVHRRADTAAIASAQSIESGYRDASARLLRALDAERNHLSPATVATLERNLAIIDAAIAESRTALAADPRDRNLAALLWAGYRQKVALLEQVTRLAEQS